MPMINESTITTASFPIKKVAYRNSTAAAQAAAGDNISRHRTSGSINVSSTSHHVADGPDNNVTASQHEARQQQRQRELAVQKEELRRVALETAQLCATGIIRTFSDFRDVKNNNNSNNDTNWKILSPIRKKNNDNKKKTSKIIEKSISSSERISAYEEAEENSEDDESSGHISHSWITSNKITTAPTQGDALPSISEEEGGRGGEKGTSPRSSKGGKVLGGLFGPNDVDDHQSSTTQTTAYRKYQEQLVKQAQNLLSSSDDVWMCSLCGTPFDSFENAEFHELHCVVNFIRCGLSTSTSNKKLALRGSNGHIEQRQYRGRNRSVSLDSLDSEYDDEQTRLFYMSAKSRTSLSQPPVQKRNSNLFRSNQSSTQKMLATADVNVSELTTKSSILSTFASLDRSEKVPSLPLALSVTPSIHLSRRIEPSVVVTRSLRGQRWIADYGPKILSYDPPPRTGGEITLPSTDLQKYMMLTDDMAVKIARRTWKILEGLCQRQLFNICLERDNVPILLPGVDKKSLLLLIQAFDAQRELEYASRDRHYYAMVEQRSLERRYGKKWSHQNAYHYHNTRITFGDILSKNILNESEEEDKELQSFGSKIISPLKDRFVHAHELIKKGPPAHNMDQYKDRARPTRDHGGNSKRRDLKHTRNTLYINVVVKNSVQVVNNELERIARGWWQDNKKSEARDFQFEWIRAVTQEKVIQLAGLALASDFTPRKVAVQLSNDLYRLIGPRLEQRGVSIQTDIEYRTGPFFVIAVEVVKIDWILLMEHTAKQERIRDQCVRALQLSKSREANDKAKGSEKGADTKLKKKPSVRQLLIAISRYFPTRNEVIAYVLATFYQLHFFISLPILQLLYALGQKTIVDSYILHVVSDDIFRYVEKKGMEMQLEICGRSSQATFMLAALREMREGKRKEDTEVGENVKPILGPLLGPAIKEDKNDIKHPSGFSLPDSLEFVGLEVDLPVGFLRLRWAMLSVAQCNFLKDAFFADIMKYDKITMGTWSLNDKEIGLPKAPDGVDESTFVGATMEYSYLMPKSAFVSANMCYATWEILQYDEYSVVIKEKTLTPEVPYGSTFISWTQYSILNTGKNSCRMVCSVEAEFPNGQPMVARQIKSGMRAGTAEKFVLLGETICRYADALP